MDKYVIYFAGGTMRGVFGAGVAAAFERNNFYPKITAIYAASAGAMTGAYFLARQTELGASIYWGNLGSNFISYKGFFIGVWQRFKGRFIKKVLPQELHDALDIGYLIQVAKEQKSLDIKKVINQNIPLNIKLFNINSHLFEYVDARRPDIFKILKTAISPFPYIHEVAVIDGKEYIDAAIMDIIGADFLKEKHPNEKVIVVMNGQIDRKLRYKLKNILEGKFTEWMLNNRVFYKLHTSAEYKLTKDLEKIKSDPNFILIAPDKHIPVYSRTTNPKLLLQLYNLGVEAGENALKNLNK